MKQENWTAKAEEIIKLCEEFENEYDMSIEVGVVDYSDNCGAPIYGITLMSKKHY